MIVPVLKVDGVDEEVVPVRFIGADGHGVVYAPRHNLETTPDPQNWRFGLAKLERPASRQLRFPQLAVHQPRSSR